MKDYQLQTPKKDHQHANRRSKSISEHTKKAQKITKKCLDSVFTSVSEELDSPTDSIGLSTISEIREDHKIPESEEGFLPAPVNSVVSPSSETVASSDLTPLSSSITGVNDEAAEVSVGNWKLTESKDSVDIGAVEAGMAVNLLKQARIQVMNSTNCSLLSRKLLDALIDVVIEEFNALPEGKERFADLVSTSARVVVLSFLLWIFAVSVVFLFSSGIRIPSSELRPT